MMATYVFKGRRTLPETRVKGPPEVWSVNIDESKGSGGIIPGLQLLWDA